MIRDLAFQRANHHQRVRLGPVDPAVAVAVRAGLVLGVVDAGPEPLARHFDQAKLRHATDMGAGAIMLQDLL